MKLKKIINSWIIITVIIILSGCNFFKVHVTYFTVNFYANDILIKTEQVKRSEFVTYPEAPEVPGYTFIEWNQDQLPIRSNVRIDAIYEINHYQITYINDGEEVANPTSYTILDEFVLNNPTKEGFLFVGWFMDDIKYEKIEKGTFEDLTLVAVYDDYYHQVYEDKLVLESIYKDILTETVDQLDPLPLVGNNNQSKITWQSNTTGFSVNPETGEVTITNTTFDQEVTLYAIIEKDNCVELCEFRFTISKIS